MKRSWTAGLTQLLALAALAALAYAESGGAMPMAQTMEPGAYVKNIEAWRAQREAKLKSDTGWLTVAGLFWLKEGDNRFGADPSNDIVLPAGSAPARAGVFSFHDQVTQVAFEPGVAATLLGGDGAPVTRMTLAPDITGNPDVLVLNRLNMFVIKRGERFAMRMRDLDSSMRKEFKGLRWYPIKESYRVTATFEPYDPPREIAIPNVLGETEKLPCPGAAVFKLDGREYRLEPVIEEPGDTQLFYIFRDQTSGRQTYGSGRFMYSDMPADGHVVLDFNKAYNPPCAFTHFATCPLPPQSNRLAVAIEAGELEYGKN